MNTPLYVAGLVAYDGTDYHGFQIQQKDITIQSELEAALFRATKQQIRVTGSGRTDAGVHASGQVIAATVPWSHSVQQLQNAWNAHLPPTIALRQLVLAPSDFHPRFSAQRRTYRYTVYDAGGVGLAEACDFDKVKLLLGKSLPLTDRFALYVPHVLDVRAMQDAAKELVGEYDFASFGQPPQGDNTVRTVYEASWKVVTTGLPLLHPYPGRQLVFTVTANAFLRQMVRNFVGSLLAVGKQQWGPNAVKACIEACDRSWCAPPAPPQGLVLEHVVYPSDLDPWQKYEQ